MCGIVGVVGDGIDIVKKMMDKIRHRGPDAHGIVELPEYCAILGHVRLSVIDLDVRSNQPFWSSCNRYLIVFNGEIYNFKKLKTRLENIGRTFRTTSDTEVLLYWLVEYGIEGISDLDGMFAFCYIDNMLGDMHLARDPLGEKPLYYSTLNTGGEEKFAFSSELPSLVDIPWVDRSLDTQGIADYIRFLYTAAPHTLYHGIKELPPGHRLHLNLKNRRKNDYTYYKLEDNIKERNLSYIQAKDIFYESFSNSVQNRMESDVPVGVYLSAGLDSNAILGIVKNLYPECSIDSFTMAYRTKIGEENANESVFAKHSANFHGIPNHTLEYDQQISLFDAVDRIVSVFGQPFGNSTALASYAMAEAVSQSHKVCLVGDGGDEILVGYPRYKALNMFRYTQNIPNYLKSIASRVAESIPERGKKVTQIRRAKQFIRQLQNPISEAYLSWVTYTDSDNIKDALGMLDETEFYSCLIDTFERYKHNPILAAALVDLKSFVPFNLMQSADRTSMMHGLELRSPFLSTSLVHSMLNIPSDLKLARGRSKPLLQDSLNTIIPPFILGKSKKSFNPPIRSYIKDNIKTIKIYLAEDSSNIRKLLGYSYIKTQVEEFEHEKIDNSTYLWGLTCLEYWMRKNY